MKVNDKEIQEFMDAKYRYLCVIAAGEQMRDNVRSKWIFHISYEVWNRLRADFTRNLYSDVLNPRHYRYREIKLFPDDSLQGLSCEIYQKKGW